MFKNVEISEAEIHYNKLYKEKNEYHHTNSVTLFIAKYDLQLQMQLSFPKWKHIFPYTFL